VFLSTSTNAPASVPMQEKLKANESPFDKATFKYKEQLTPIMETPDRSNDFLHNKMSAVTPGTASIDSYTTASPESKLNLSTTISDVSMTDVVPPPPPQDTSFQFPFNFDTPPASRRKGRWISSQKGNWSEKPRLPQGSSVNKASSLSQGSSIKASSPRKRRSTVPLDCPIANRPTQSWMARNSTPVENSSSSSISQRPSKKRKNFTVPLDCPIADRPTQSWMARNSTPVEDSSSSSISQRPTKKRKNFTVPLDCPIANRPTKSWLAKLGQLEDCSHLARTSNNKRQKGNRNYLPSSSMKRHRGGDGDESNSVASSSYYSMSSQVFPPPKHLFQFTTPDVVQIADHSTQAWNSKLKEKTFVKEEATCPYLMHNETLKTPNGQYSLYNQRNFRR
jgi:hypothetical protein